MPVSAITSWIEPLVSATKHVLAAKNLEKRTCDDLLSYGYRRKKFLIDEEEQYCQIRPFFGLCNPPILMTLSESLDIDCGIEYLRRISKEIGLESKDAIICYSEFTSKQRYVEYATVGPYLSSSTKRNIEGDYCQKCSHARWILIRDNPPVKFGGRGCKHPCHADKGDDRNFQIASDIDKIQRMNAITAKAEQCLYIEDPKYAIQESSSGLRWPHSPPLFLGPVRAEDVDLPCHPLAEGNPRSSCSCFIPSSSPNNVNFKLLIAHRSFTEERNGFELWVKADILANRSKEILQDKVKHASQLTLKPSEGLEWLRGPKLNPIRVWDYIQEFIRLERSARLIITETVETPAGLDWKSSHGRSIDLISNTIYPSTSAAWLASLETLGVFSKIYDSLEGATISLKVVETPLFKSSWIPNRQFQDALRESYVQTTHHGDPLKGSTSGAQALFELMSREHTLACISMFQTGICQLEPEDFHGVMAISSENSIFVAASLLKDPYETVNGSDIKHIIGNIGYPGLCLMVTPENKLYIRPLSNTYRMVQHAFYDSQREDKFTGTSLHLRFTGQRIPLVHANNIDAVDQEVFYLQSVVSLWSNGEHIADLDLLAVSEDESLDPLARIKIECKCILPNEVCQNEDVISIDSWEELLDPPGAASVVRANKNWAARLAAVSILIQQGKGHALSILEPGRVCWRCLQDMHSFPQIHLPDFLID